MHRRARGGTTRVQERGRTPCQRTRLIVEAGLGERRANEGIQSVAVSEAGLKPEIFETNSANTRSAWRGLDYTLFTLAATPLFPPVLGLDSRLCLSARFPRVPSEFACAPPNSAIAFVRNARLILTTPVVADKTPHTPSCCLGQPDRLAGTSRGDSRVRIILSRARRRGRLRTMALN